MTRDELIQRLVGRTIVGVAAHDGGLIESIDLDDGSRLNLGVGDGTLEHPWAEIECRLEPGFAGSMWGEARTFDGGVELVPLVVGGKVEALFVQTKPAAAKVDADAIESAWLGRPYSDWSALPR